MSKLGKTKIKEKILILVGNLLMMNFTLITFLFTNMCNCTCVYKYVWYII